MSSSFVKDCSDVSAAPGNSSSGKTVIIIVNNETGNTSLDQDELQNLLANHVVDGSQVSVVRMGSGGVGGVISNPGDLVANPSIVASADGTAHVNFTVEGYPSIPLEAGQVSGGMNYAELPLDQDAFQRLESVLDSEEAREILGEPLLSMVANPDQLGPLDQLMDSSLFEGAEQDDDGDDVEEISSEGNKTGKKKTRSPPKRRSQRQMDKAEREEVEKILAENQKLLKEEKQQLNEQQVIERLQKMNTDMDEVSAEEEEREEESEEEEDVESDTANEDEKSKATSTESKRNTIGKRGGKSGKGRGGRIRGKGKVETEKEKVTEFKGRGKGKKKIEEEEPETVVGRGIGRGRGRGSMKEEIVVSGKGRGRGATKKEEKESTSVGRRPEMVNEDKNANPIGRRKKIDACDSIEKLKVQRNNKKNDVEETGDKETKGNNDLSKDNSNVKVIVKSLSDEDATNTESGRKVKSRKGSRGRFVSDDDVSETESVHKGVKKLENPKEKDNASVVEEKKQRGVRNLKGKDEALESKMDCSGKDNDDIKKVLQGDKERECGKKVHLRKSRRGMDNKDEADDLQVKRGAVVEEEKMNVQSSNVTEKHTEEKEIPPLESVDKVIIKTTRKHDNMENSVHTGSNSNKTSVSEGEAASSTEEKMKVDLSDTPKEDALVAGFNAGNAGLQIKPFRIALEKMNVDEAFEQDLFKGMDMGSNVSTQSEKTEVLEDLENKKEKVGVATSKSIADLSAEIFGDLEEHEREFEHPDRCKLIPETPKLSHFQPPLSSTPTLAGGIASQNPTCKDMHMHKTMSSERAGARDTLNTAPLDNKGCEDDGLLPKTPEKTKTVVVRTGMKKNESLVLAAASLEKEIVTDLNKTPEKMIVAEGKSKLIQVKSPMGIRQVVVLNSAKSVMNKETLVKVIDPIDPPKEEDRLSVAKICANAKKEAAQKKKLSHQKKKNADDEAANDIEDFESKQKNAVAVGNQTKPAKDKIGIDNKPLKSEAPKREAPKIVDLEMKLEDNVQLKKKEAQRKREEIQRKREEILKKREAIKLRKEQQIKESMQSKKEETPEQLEHHQESKMEKNTQNKKLIISAAAKNTNPDLIKRSNSLESPTKKEVKVIVPSNKELQRSESVEVITTKGKGQIPNPKAKELQRSESVKVVAVKSKGQTPNPKAVSAEISPKNKGKASNKNQMNSKKVIQKEPEIVSTRRASLAKKPVEPVKSPPPVVEESPVRRSGRAIKKKTFGDEMVTFDLKASAPEADDETASEEDMESEPEEDEDSVEDYDDPERLWCICQKPHNNRFMICCDRCEDWFHGTCVNITKALGQQMEDEGQEWVCPKCKKAEKAMKSMGLSSHKKDSLSLASGTTTQILLSQKSKVEAKSASSSMKDDSKKNVELDNASKRETQTNHLASRKVSTTTGKKPEISPLVQTPGKGSDDKAESKVDVPSSSLKGATKEVNKCVLESCKKPRKADGVYCSNECVLKHAQMSLRILGKTDKDLEEHHIPGVTTTTLKNVPRVVVFEKSTGKLLTGSDAPPLREMQTWLKDHPEYAIVPAEVMQTSGVVVKKSIAADGTVAGNNASAPKKLIQLTTQSSLSAFKGTTPKLTVVKAADGRIIVRSADAASKTLVNKIVTSASTTAGTSKVGLTSSNLQPVVASAKPLDKEVDKINESTSARTLEPITEEGHESDESEENIVIQKPIELVKKVQEISPVKKTLENTITKSSESPKALLKVADVSSVKTTDSGAKIPDSSSKVTPLKDTKKTPSKGPLSEKKSADPNEVRANVRKTLAECLLKRSKETVSEFENMSEEDLHKLAAEVEKELFIFFNKDIGFKYKSRYRSLLFNIRDTKNSGLFRKILNGTISPAALAKMTSEELASKELAEWREREEKKELQAIEKYELDMISLGNQYIMKSHKGEIEIDKDDFIKDKEKAPETINALPTDEVMGVLEDTTSSHKNHLFDVNCKICTESTTVSEDMKLKIKYQDKKEEKKSDSQKSKDRKERKNSSDRDKERHRHKSRDQDRDKDKKHRRDRSREKEKEDKSRTKDISKDRRDSEKESSKDRRDSEKESSKDRRDSEKEISKDRRDSEKESSKDRRDSEKEISKDRRDSEKEISKDRRDSEKDRSKDKHRDRKDSERERHKSSEKKERRDSKVDKEKRHKHKKDRRSSKDDKDRRRKDSESREKKRRHSESRSDDRKRRESEKSRTRDDDFVETELEREKPVVSTSDDIIVDFEHLRRESISHLDADAKDSVPTSTVIGSPDIIELKDDEYPEYMPPLPGEDAPEPPPLPEGPAPLIMDSPSTPPLPDSPLTPPLPEDCLLDSPKTPSLPDEICLSPSTVDDDDFPNTPPLPDNDYNLVTPPLPSDADDFDDKPLTPPIPYSRGMSSSQSSLEDKDRLTPPLESVHGSGASSSPTPAKMTEPVVVWKGAIRMTDVSKFNASAFEVSGKAKFLPEDVPKVVEVVGRISPDTVWSYIAQTKKTGSKEILVVRFQPSNEEEKVSYIALYSYLSSKKRYGVIGNCEKAVKDFYVVPLASHQPIPQVLLPLDGPGFEEHRAHMLIGVIVRAKHRRIYDHITGTWQIVGSSNNPPSNPPHKSSDQPERSYTPPLPSDPDIMEEINLTSTDSSEEEVKFVGRSTTPPGKKSKDEEPEIILSGKLKRRAKSQPDIEQPKKRQNLDCRIQEVMEEPKSPPENSFVDGTLDQESMLAELNRQIEVHKKELSEMQKTVMNEEEEPYSPSMFNNTSPGEEPLKLDTSKISIPSNLQEILNNIKEKELEIKNKEQEIKRRLSLAADPIVLNYAKLPEAEMKSMSEQKMPPPADVDLRPVLHVKPKEMKPKEDVDLRVLQGRDPNELSTSSDMFGKTDDTDLRVRDPRLARAHAAAVMEAIEKGKTLGRLTDEELLAKAIEMEVKEKSIKCSQLNSEGDNVFQPVPPPPFMAAGPSGFLSQPSPMVPPNAMPCPQPPGMVGIPYVNQTGQHVNIYGPGSRREPSSQGPSGMPGPPISVHEGTQMGPSRLSNPGPVGPPCGPLMHDGPGLGPCGPTMHDRTGLPPCGPPVPGSMEPPRFGESSRYQGDERQWERNYRDNYDKRDWDYDHYRDSDRYRNSDHYRDSEYYRDKDRDRDWQRRQDRDGGSYQHYPHNRKKKGFDGRGGGGGGGGDQPKRVRKKNKGYNRNGNKGNGGDEGDHERRRRRDNYDGNSEGSRERKRDRFHGGKSKKKFSSRNDDRKWDNLDHTNRGGEKYEGSGGPEGEDVDCPYEIDY